VILFSLVLIASLARCEVQLILAKTKKAICVSHCLRMFQEVLEEGFLF